MCIRDSLSHRAPSRVITLVESGDKVKLFPKIITLSLFNSLQGSIMLRVSKSLSSGPSCLILSRYLIPVSYTHLDVYKRQVEPLPEEDELWDLENVYITPHASGTVKENKKRLADLIIANIQRLSLIHILQCLRCGGRCLNSLQPPY